MLTRLLTAPSFILPKITRYKQSNSCTIGPERGDKKNMITTEQAKARRIEIGDRLGVVNRVLSGKVCKADRPLWEREKSNLEWELETLEGI